MPLAIIAGAVIIVLAIVAFVINGAGKETYRSVKIVETEGDIKIDREDIGELQASSNMNLVSGDTVTTGNNSSAVLLLDTDKYVYLDCDSKIQIVADGDTANGKIEIQIENGTILNEIQNPLQNGDSYAIKTPNATMSVRGTVFEVRRNTSDNDIELLVYDGKVGLGFGDKPENLYTKGEYTKFEDKENPNFIVERSSITDDVMNDRMKQRLSEILKDGRDIVELPTEDTSSKEDVIENNSNNVNELQQPDNNVSNDNTNLANSNTPVGNDSSNSKVSKHNDRQNVSSIPTIVKHSENRQSPTPAKHADNQNSSTKPTVQKTGVAPSNTSNTKNETTKNNSYVQPSNAPNLSQADVPVPPQNNGVIGDNVSDSANDTNDVNNTDTNNSVGQSPENNEGDQISNTSNSVENNNSLASSNTTGSNFKPKKSTSSSKKHNTTETTTKEETTTEPTTEKNTTEPTPEETTETVTETTSESVTESTTETSTEVTTSDNTETTTKKDSGSNPVVTTESTSESTTEITSEVSTEVTSETFSEVSTEITTEITSDSSTETTTKKDSGSNAVVTTESTSETSSEETSEDTGGDTTESTSESTTETTTESTSESSTEVSTESTSESSTEVSTELTSESSTEVSTESTSESSTEVSTESTSESSTEVSTEENTETTSEEPPYGQYAYIGYYIPYIYEVNDSSSDQAITITDNTPVWFAELHSNVGNQLAAPTDPIYTDIPKLNDDQDFSKLEFAGWYAKGGNGLWDFDNPDNICKSTQMSMYAVWRNKETGKMYYPIIFTDIRENTPYIACIEENATVDMKPDEKYNYTFDYWYSLSNGYWNNIVTGADTLKPVWKNANNPNNTNS